MSSQQTGTLTLFSAHKTDYGISLLHPLNKSEIQARAIIEKFFFKVSGVKLSSTTEKFTIKVADVGEDLPAESFQIKNEDRNILLEGNQKGLVYAAYFFVENFLKCRKFSPGEEAFCPQTTEVTIPLPIEIDEKPSFAFREVYSLAETDEEYLDWHHLHHLEKLWGLWGHSFQKIVPISNFKTHPEYFAFYGGRRHPTQLCLSNEHVFEIAVKNLKKYFAENPAAQYWSVSPNDNAGFCECRLCLSADSMDGGKQGSLLQFVNKIARNFPEKTFTTLAYNATEKPPLITVPEKNVIIFLSNINVKRTFSIDSEASAEEFRKNLEGWSQKTDRIFIWDYYTQFTNFFAPFPNYYTFQPNLKYYENASVKGIFAQLSGTNYSDFAKIKMYLLAKLLWNPQLSEDILVEDFLKGYFGKSAPFMKSYISQLYLFAQESGTRLDIYGNPVNNYNDFLTPQNLKALNSLMDEAENAAENKEVILRIQKPRLSLDYTFLQQAKFYGMRKYSFFDEEKQKWIINPEFKAKVYQFIKRTEDAGIKELSEGGISPQEYGAEWERIFKEEIRENLAENAQVILEYPFAPEYPAKKEKTLTDGVPGYNDFSYNWLCFYGKPMVALLDLGKNTEIRQIEIDFLEDVRHWIFRPQKIKIEYSLDGENYLPAGNIINNHPENSGKAKKVHSAFQNLNFTARFLRVTAENQPKLPSFVSNRNKKPMIACDEIWVN